MARGLKLAIVSVAVLVTGLASSTVLAQSARKKPVAPSGGGGAYQQVIPPKSVYWLSATTQSGFAMGGGQAPGRGDMMKMMMGGGMGGDTKKLLQLDLGSKLPPAGPPAAQHLIPPGMSMGQSLPLKTPKPVKTTNQTAEPPDYERPKGRLLLFWGCGEKAGPGQPVVIDFGKMAEGVVPQGLFGGEHISLARPPSASTWPTYGSWPNDDRTSRQGVPYGASLIGPHKVAGNYVPDSLNFTLDEDWMGALDLAQQKLPSGAVGLKWNALPHATSHFAQMMGGGRDQGGGTTMVFWSSSEVQTFISGLSDFISPAEAARLVRARYLMPASQTTCTISKEAMAATQGGGMLSLVAHGPEQNIVYPPRPSDPHTPWVQDWAVKARFASRTGALAGMDSPGRDGRRGRADCEARPSTGSMLGSALGGPLGGALGGVMGGKPKKPDGCPN